MDNVLLHLGIGGIFAIMLLREILPYLKTKNTVNGGSGQYVTKHEIDTYFSKVQMKDVCAAEMKAFNVRFDSIEHMELERLRHEQEQFKMVHDQLSELKALISTRNNK